MQERLQKYLARCGVASRRKCEELIVSGSVEIDGVLVTELGTKVDPEKCTIKVVGERVEPSPLRYFALNKPAGVVCTNRDPAGRPRAVDLIPTKGIRVYPVGRLDEQSEGLILLTNDGELTDRITHPRNQVPKVYQVIVKGEAPEAALEKLRKGVWLSEGRTSPMKVKVARKTHETTSLLITLIEGRNRHLRRVLAKVALPVKRLKRVRVGPVSLGSLKRGEWRKLSRDEIQALQEGSNTPPKSRGKRPRRQKPKPSRRKPPSGP